MLKGKGFSSKVKLQDAVNPVIKTSESQSEVAKESTSEAICLPDEANVSGGAEATSGSLCIDSSSAASSEGPINTAPQSVEIHADDSVLISEEKQAERNPQSTAEPDEICRHEQTESSSFVEDEGDLLGKLFSFSFMSEKKPNNGEDSDALLFLNSKISAVGVFDGMGGAGSSIHIVGDQEKTVSYLSSRKTKDSIDDFLKSIGDLRVTEIDSLKYDEEFKQAIIESLNNLRKECPPKVKSGLKSAMIKEFPTTLAITTLRKRRNKYLIDSYWAGDSRNYILSSKGLFQTSVDDLERQSDPYENLYSDSPLSNQICADRPFRINHLAFEPETMHFAIISASDGCYGYYPTPMHFEDALLRNLHDANSLDEWNNALKVEFSDIAADDTSLSCIINGFDSFDAFKAIMEERFTTIHAFIEEYNEILNELTDLKRKFEEKEAYFKAYKQEQWGKYKIDYMSLLNISDTND